MEALLTAAGQVGFPIVAALYFIYRDGKQTDKIISMTLQAIESTNASTVAIKASTEAQLKVAETLQNFTGVFNRYLGGKDVQQ